MRNLHALSTWCLSGNSGSVTPHIQRLGHHSKLVACHQGSLPQIVVFLTAYITIPTQVSSTPRCIITLPCVSTLRLGKTLVMIRCEVCALFTTMARTSECLAFCGCGSPFSATRFVCLQCVPQDSACTTPVAVAVYLASTNHRRQETPPTRL